MKITIKRNKTKVYMKCEGEFPRISNEYLWASASTFFPIPYCKEGEYKVYFGAKGNGEADHKTTFYTRKKAKKSFQKTYQATIELFKKANKKYTVRGHFVRTNS